MTHEILKVTAEGEFIWHPDADNLIATGDFSYSPSTKYILERLRKFEEPVFSDWQPAETAPVGCEVLTWNGRYQRVAIRTGKKISFMDKRTGQTLSPRVTHYKPLEYPLADVTK